MERVCHASDMGRKTGHRLQLEDDRAASRKPIKLIPRLGGDASPHLLLAFPRLVGRTLWVSRFLDTAVEKMSVRQGRRTPPALDESGELGTIRGGSRRPWRLRRQERHNTRNSVKSESECNGSMLTPRGEGHSS